MATACFCHMRSQASMLVFPHRMSGLHAVLFWSLSFICPYNRYCFDTYVRELCPNGCQPGDQLPLLMCPQGLNIEYVMVCNNAGVVIVRIHGIKGSYLWKLIVTSCSACPAHLAKEQGCWLVLFQGSFDVIQLHSSRWGCLQIDNLACTSMHQPSALH